MSRAWGAGSTRAWRRTRAVVLVRDGYRCQIRIKGLCLGGATVVHHMHGKGQGDDPSRLQAACAPCNARVNDPLRASGHLLVVAWARERGRVTTHMLRDRFPDTEIGIVLRRAVRRGELVRVAPGVYRSGPTGLPPNIANIDPQPRMVTRW